MPQLHNLTNHDYDVPVDTGNGPYTVLGPKDSGQGGNSGPPSFILINDEQKVDLLKMVAIKTACERRQLQIL